MEEVELRAEAFPMRVIGASLGRRGSHEDIARDDSAAAQAVAVVAGASPVPSLGRLQQRAHWGSA